VTTSETPPERNASANLAGYRVDHIGVVVPDLERATRFYHDVLGCPVREPIELAGQGIAVVFVSFANTRVELIAPTTAMSPLGDLLEDHTVNDFLARKPEGGMHHICYEVDDLDAVLGRLVAAGARILGTGKPIIGASGKPIVFLDPRNAEGTLIELKQAG
jgi:methylmalonyl-CoA/ethylmalonyl-CoA epimerase